MIRKMIETEKAVGELICHDITKIEKGEFKGALFKKGHRIRPEDISALLDIGKKHIYTLRLEEGELHEDDAGIRLAEALAGNGLHVGKPAEGRLDLTAKYQGLFKVDIERLHRLNSVQDVVVATLHNNSPLVEGEKVAGAKVIPLVVKEETLAEVESICSEGEAPLKVIPYNKHKIGAIITGMEIAEGRIKDGFAPVLEDKTRHYSQGKPLVSFAKDNVQEIASKINQLLTEGCNMIVTTGGMSVDPDDVTPTAIKESGAEIIKYGAPALPGAMFLLAYRGDIPIIGLPACAMYFQNTVLDILLPRLLVGEKITASEIAALGHGGLCRRCETCFFPRCSFGKSGY